MTLFYQSRASIIRSQTVLLDTAMTEQSTVAFLTDPSIATVEPIWFIRLSDQLLLSRFKLLAKGFKKMITRFILPKYYTER